MRDKKKNNKPALDLSFAYGTTIIKQLSEQDIRMLQAADAAAEEDGHSDDPTIRTVTSLFSGTRGITGLMRGENDQEPDTEPDVAGDDDDT